MQILLVSNMIYALVLPVIDVFVAAYVLRNSSAVDKVFVYQLSVYLATPAAFLANGLLLGRAGAKHLYAAGMVLSGLAMVLLMHGSTMTYPSIAAAGLSMGLATGLFWANRVVLALTSTSDGNRNYFYGVELFFATLAAVVIPALVGWFISQSGRQGSAMRDANQAYRAIAACFLLLTITAAAVLELGSFRNPPPARFIFFKFHALWRPMIELALLKGLAQGYIVTAPAMLILRFVGREGTLGATQAVGGIVSAILMYATGRIAQPRHRNLVFSAGLLLFFAGAAANALLFNAAGALLFIGCLLLAKPLLDLGYNPIELSIVDAVSRREQRGQYAYLFNHELGLFTGRALGCLLFLAICYGISGAAALRYAMLVIAALQLLSARIAGRVLSRI